MTEKGQLYEIAQGAIEDALVNSNPEATMQFKEKAHSRIAEGEQAELDAGQNPYVKRLEELGVKTDTEQPLAKVVAGQTSGAGNRTGIKDLLKQVENV